MKNTIDNILTEWAYKVPNGSPDTKDSYHLFLLRGILYEMGWSQNTVNKFLLNLTEESKSDKPTRFNQEQHKEKDEKKDLDSQVDEKSNDEKSDPGEEGEEKDVQPVTMDIEADPFADEDSETETEDKKIKTP